MIKQIPTHRMSSNFATADRPRCMTREQQNSFLSHPKDRRYFHYDNGYNNETYWNWNMSHLEYDHVVSSSSSSKKSQKPSKNNGYYPSSRSTSSTSGLNSFFRWFRRDNKSKVVNDISYPRDIIDTFETYDDEFMRNTKNDRQKLKQKQKYNPPSTSQPINNAFYSSSSCDSVFSTASSFAFVTPVKYLKNRNQKQPTRQQQHQKQIDDRSYTESYQKRVKARHQALERDKREEITLRRKYHLYDESDAESSSTLRPIRNFEVRFSQEFNSHRTTNLPDSEKLQDLNSKQHRRTVSDTHEDKKIDSGSYLHVKGKRKAPSPPKSRTNPRTLSPKTSLGRKKRPAPLPPVQKFTEEASTATASSTSLLDDKDIKALIEGKFPKKDYSSTPTLPTDMERKPTYVSPYLKIREDMKLTDEQKRVLIAQVSTKPTTSKKIEDQMFTIQEGQLVYQGNESPKLAPTEEKLVAPPSPISPRPWFKRNPNLNCNQKDSNQSIFKTLEKKIHKSDEKEKDLPEYGYSRNSFFGNRFNIFSKLTGEDAIKKKEKDQEKRKSQIGMPNISELDREAAEIIQIGQELKKDVNEVLMMRAQNNLEDKQKSTKDLINKFEIDSTQFSPRVVSLNSTQNAKKEFFGESEVKVEESESLKKLKNDVKNSPMGTRKSKLPQLMNGIRKQDDLMGLWTCTYCTLENPNWKIICEACEKVKPYEKKYNVNNGDLHLKSKDNISWEKKTEMVKKYFQPPMASGLAKSSSETIIGKSLSVKPSKIPGSPLMNFRRNTKNSPEKKVTNGTYKKISEDDIKTERISPIKTPDLNEIRNARLARFNQKLHENENSNLTRKQSPEKLFTERINFNDPQSLEREKERLREKIRQMNSKAMTEKYPVHKPIKQIELQKHEIPSAPVLTPTNTNDSPTKLGAIKKVRKVEEIVEEKIINKNEEVTKSDSTSQTTLKNNKKKIEDENHLPITILDISEKPTQENFTANQKVEVNKISDQLQSRDGIKNFKASLAMNKTDTLAINKILRYLELAIMEGNHHEAAQFAMDLAKMKVSVSVTKQSKSDRPKSEIDQSLQNVKVNLNIRNGVKDVVKKQLSISLLMTLSELKQKIEIDYQIPISNQKLFINKDLIDNGDDKFLGNFVRSDGMMDIVVYNKKPLNNTPKPIRANSESDDETQNEKVGNETEIGAVGGKVLSSEKVEFLEKIENKGWECTLCTLINKPEAQGCAACSTSRPNPHKLQTNLNDLEYKLKVNEDLQKFYEIEKIEFRQSNNSKNDLNRLSANRKSSDILNILKDEKIGLTESSSSPNISKNKYRGVDNFNPNITYAFPKTTETPLKPIITNVIYKSTLSETKESIKARLNHYQELMNLDIANIAPNKEKFECSICFLEISSGAGAILRDCLHTFCRLCLASHIRYSEEPEIKCPYIDHQYSCQSVLQEREIRALISKEEYDAHLAKSIRIAENKIENTFHCKTPNCSGWCIFEDNTNTFKCPVCTIVNCLTCGAIHDGINCKQFQDQLANNNDTESAQETKKLLQELIEKDEAINCPTCHIFLLKKWGCDWLKCSFCKTEICWVTKGPRWGANGKGDTSGGCKCGVNGKKCSPKCNYCH